MQVTTMAWAIRRFATLLLAAAGQSDQAWTSTAIRAFGETEQTAGIHPEVVAIASWNQWPNLNLPETKAGTLTDVLLAYLRFRGARN